MQRVLAAHSIWFLALLIVSINAEASKVSNPVSMLSKSDLKSIELPDDLRLLLEHPEQADAILNDLETRFFVPGEDVPLISGSYLTEADRNDREIVANVAAIEAVFQHITFVVEFADGSVIGYWHGPDKLDMSDAPIVKFDTEGQFRLCGGASLIEALVGEYSYDDDDEFADFQSRLGKLGIDIVSKWDELTWPEMVTKPDQLHEAYYAKFLEKD